MFSVTAHSGSPMMLGQPIPQVNMQELCRQKIPTKDGAVA